MIQPPIKFTVLKNGTNFQIETYDGEYRNLMVLLREKVCLDDFGECGGMGRCGTCIIKVSGLSGDSIVKERNEPTTLAIFGYFEENIRLSCQIQIVMSLNDTLIEILE